jgi:hypothetical protein
MPRVHHVKKARKDNPVAKRGESYYWWKFRYGGKHYSLTRPKASQLTQSPYLAIIYDASDEWGNVNDPTCIDVSDLPDSRDAIVEDLQSAASGAEGVKALLEELPDMYEESASNMEEYFPTHEKIDDLRNCASECESTIEQLDEMIDQCNAAADEIQAFELDDDLEDNVQGALDSISWDDPNLDFHEV